MSYKTKVDDILGKRDEVDMAQVACMQPGMRVVTQSGQIQSVTRRAASSQKSRVVSLVK